MLLQELMALLEGGYVLQNRSGQRKTFKDPHSPTATAFQSSESKAKPKTNPKFSQAWWDDKEYNNDVKLVPWTRIEDHELDEDSLKDVFTAGGFRKENVDHWSIQKRTSKEFEGVDCAGIVLRIATSYGKEDDMGLDVKDGERVEEGQAITVYRSPKKPETFVFGKYTW